jgi:hypothetical protein
MSNKMYTFAEIENWKPTKDELFEGAPAHYDFALPQFWLDDFATWCCFREEISTSNHEAIDYDWIVSTTCWDCNKNQPVFKAVEIAEAYKVYRPDYVIDSTDDYRILTLKAALKLEVAGMTRRGRSVYAIVKDEFGFRGSKQKVLDQLEAYCQENILKGKTDEHSKGV